MRTRGQGRGLLSIHRVILDSPDLYVAALNGGRLHVESGQVVAYVDQRRLGVIDSDEVAAHLAAGGQAYFRLEHVSLGAPLAAVCTLL